MNVIKYPKAIITFIIILFISLVIFALFSSPFKKNINRIKIIDGNSGEQIVFEQERAQFAIKELSALTCKMNGLSRGWTCGYMYKIELDAGVTVQEIKVYSPYEFVRGGIKYITNENIEEIINKIIREYAYDLQ